MKNTRLSLILPLTVAAEIAIESFMFSACLVTEFDLDQTDYFDYFETNDFNR